MFIYPLVIYLSNNSIVCGINTGKNQKRGRNIPTLTNNI